MEPVILDEINVEIDRRKVFIVLGGANKKSGWSGGQARARIESAAERAGNLIEPKGIYTFTSGKKLKGPAAFRNLEKVAVCVCTIGNYLEDEAARLFQEGSLLEALVLDVAGSLAAESTAEYIDRAIKRLAEEKGEKTSRRASPGYGDWKVEGQRRIFEILPAKRIGVSLTRSMMMSPRKSISFAAHVAEDPVNLRSADSCRDCAGNDCPFGKL